MRHVPEAMVFDFVPRLAALIDSSPSQCPEVWN